MSGMVEVIRRIVLQEMAAQRGCALAVVTAVYPHEGKDDDNNYEIDVRLKHEGLELHKVPLMVTHVGVAALPKANDLVLVDFVQGDVNQPVVTGRFYHADERPPLHKRDELLFEQRVSDDTLNHLRFTADGTIFLQRDVKKPEDNSEAKTSLKIDGKTGSVEMKIGDKITLLITEDEGVKLTVTDKPVEIESKEFTLTADTVTITGETKIDGPLTVTKDTELQGQLKVGGPGGSTTIKGNEITGGLA